MATKGSLRRKRAPESEEGKETARLRLTTEERKRNADSEEFNREARVRQEDEDGGVAMQEDQQDEGELKADEVMSINWITASDFCGNWATGKGHQSAGWKRGELGVTSIMQNRSLMLFFMDLRKCHLRIVLFLG